MLHTNKESKNVACPRCGFGAGLNNDVDFRKDSVIIIKDKKIRKPSVDIIIQNYHHRRFDMMIKPMLKSIGERIPSVNDILSILYEKKDEPQNNICPCQDKESHFVRHLYTVVIRGQGVPLYMGERCFINHGYPLSLCRALEKTRRIIQNDIEKIVKLTPEELEVAIDICKKTVDVILQNKYTPGILFLREFGGTINDLFNSSLCLPPWLAYMLGSLARNSIENLPQAKQAAREKNRSIYQAQYDFMTRLDNVVFGRCKFLKDMMRIIDDGGDLTPQQENAINSIMEKHDEALLQKTEEALPFLLALNNGKIILLEQDATVFPGQHYPIFQSMFRQVEKGNCLTVKQIQLLRYKYKAYKTQYLNLSTRERLATIELVQAYTQADKDNDVLAKQETSDVLLARGVTMDKINIASEMQMT